MSSDPALPVAGTQVLVHGLGRFGGGRESILYLRRLGCEVRVADRSADASLRAAADEIGDPGIDWQLGREDLDLLDGVDLVVTSPAIPDHSALRQEALRRGLPATQECELFLAAYPGRVVGVTGTNGKSSTASLLHRALCHAGVDALLGGNIGHSLLADAAEWRPDQVAVLELSSFQLERFATDRALHAAVFTRVGSDHLDRHGSLMRYRAAKGRLASAARDFIIHAADDPVAGSYPTGAARRGRYGLAAAGPNSAGVCAGYLTIRPDAGPARPIVHRDALQLLGGFQIDNVLASSLAASWLGAEFHQVGIAMATATPLPFRLQLLRTVGGVHVYDNGVSTEVESTRHALKALRERVGRVHWLGGGQSKDGDYAKVARAVAALATSAHVFGAAGAPFQAAAADSVPTTRHEAMAGALSAAMQHAAPGDAVLFSPAFASFDQYANFRARALEFHSLARELGANNVLGG